MRTIHLWTWIHKWSSLICTVFLLMLCITGLPLIFKAEIAAWAKPPAPRPAVDARLQPLGADRLVAIARARHPGEQIRVVEPLEGNRDFSIFMGPTPEPGPGSRWMLLDTRTGARIDAPPTGAPDPITSRIMHVVDEVHSELLAGEPGEILLCVMAVLFVVSLVSGAVLYPPFVGRQRFGTVRYDRSSRIRWLNLHKVLGIVVLAWMLVVGATGALNTLSGMMLDRWQSQALPALTAAYRSQEVVREPASLDQALATAHQAAPGMRVGVVMFPNRNWGSPNHYFMLATGTSPLTSRLRTAILIDARTGQLTAAQPFPWYLRMIEVSRPLHFGDYGGLPLKLLWALFDVVTLIVLISGLVLWMSKHRKTSGDAGGGPRAVPASRPRGRARRSGQMVRQIWRWPVSLAGLTVAGLLGALLNPDGVVRVLSWIALAVPLLVILHATRRRTMRTDER
jgi:uncharacterized iron-regulated membrane protein